MENNEEKLLDVEEMPSNPEKIEISEKVSEEEVVEQEGTPRHASGNDDKKKNGLTKKQKIQITVSIIILILVIVSIVLFFLLRKPKQKKSPSSDTNMNSNIEEPINYQEIVNEYGSKLDELVVNYSKQNGKAPELEGILEYAKVGDYKIVCKESSINSNKKVYLGECSINDSKEVYSYGEKEIPKPAGETLKVYKGNTKNNGIVYTFSLDYYEDEKGKFSEIATVPCKEGKCEGEDVFERYAVTYEKETLYIYDYVDKKYLDVSILSPDECEILNYNEKIYGIYYSKNEKDYFYSLSAGKVFSIEGSFSSGMGWEPSVMLPSGYIPLSIYEENGDVVTNKVDFVNLKTGKVIYTIENVSSFDIDSETNKTYILQSIEIKNGEDISYRYKIYDSKGFVLFDGEVFDAFYSENGRMITVKDGVYKIYNSNYQTTYTSKKYSDVLTFWKDYILVVDGTNLNLINYKETVLTTFLKDWSEEKYFYHSMLSGWYTENGKNGIYLVIEGGDVSKSEILKNNPDMTLEDLDSYDLGYEYYYIPTTKETGKIPTYIGGYAKPVLYLYPMLPTFVNVTFKYPESLTTTYPKYKDNWKIFAIPNGDLRDLENKYYYGLYWEENLNHRVDFKEGFYVTKENAIEFLEEKLSIIGLNDRERNEFIMYWLPILEKNGKSLVYFELTEERDSYSPIYISPKPNSMLRMAIHVKKVDKKVNIKEQKLATFKRTGFTAVEWGGINY